MTTNNCSTQPLPVVNFFFLKKMDLIKRDENVDELLHAQDHVLNHTFIFHGTQVCCSTRNTRYHPKPWSTHDNFRAGFGSWHPPFESTRSQPPYENPCSFWILAKHDKIGQITDNENAYVLTPDSRLLLKDNPLSTRSFLLLVVDPITNHFLKQSDVKCVIFRVFFFNV